jgi:hypothetical protein
MRTPKEPVGIATRDTNNANPVVIGRLRIGELRPIVIDDPPRHDIDPMAQLRQRERHILHVHELAAEIGVFGPVGIRRIEVPLRVEKREVHSQMVGVEIQSPGPSTLAIDGIHA